jgi:RNA polymerase sigma-70 factor (sigma-E family)
VSVVREEPNSMRRVVLPDDEFREFARRQLPILLRGAYLLLRDIDLAEDAVQGTMLRVFRHWSDARQAPEAYSRTALVSVCRDHWRRQRRRPQEVLAEEAESLPGETSFSELFEEREALSQALYRLADQQREVLVLRFFFDCSVGQAAEMLEIPEGTVKSATHRGLQELRALLDPSEEVSAC